MAGLDPNSVRMSLGDHLEELRRRVLWGLAGPLVGAVIGLIFGKSLLTLALLPYVEAQRAAGFPASAEALNVTETFGAYLKVSLLCGLVLGLPWMLWQMWKFISVGLYERERKLVVALVPGSTLLTFAGLAFMYLIMLPVMVSFFIRFAASMPIPEAGESRWFGWIYDKLELTDLAHPPNDGDHSAGGNTTAPDAANPLFPHLPVLTEDPADPGEGQIWIVGSTIKLRAAGRTLSFIAATNGPIAQRQRLTEWISLVLNLAIAFALTFQTPLVLVLVNRVHLVSLKRLQSIRKYALLGAFVLGAVFTPADPVSQILLAVPIYALYELGMVLCRLLNRQGEALIE